MSAILNLNRHRKARIWLADLPELSYPAEKYVERTLDAKKSEMKQIKFAAIEMVVPSAGRVLYGILGAKFSSNRSNQLVVKVAVSDRTEKEVEWSLVSGLDRVNVGLPFEYADSVLDGTVGAEEILGSGVLLFNCAAHGEVGSSPRIFRQLAMIIVRLVASQKESVSEEELAVMVGNY